MQLMQSFFISLVLFITAASGSIRVASDVLPPSDSQFDRLWESLGKYGALLCRRDCPSGQLQTYSELLVSVTHRFALADILEGLGQNITPDLREKFGSDGMTVLERLPECSLLIKKNGIMSFINELLKNDVFWTDNQRRLVCLLLGDGMGDALMVYFACNNQPLSKLSQIVSFSAFNLITKEKTYDPKSCPHLQLRKIQHQLKDRIPVELIIEVMGATKERSECRIGSVVYSAGQLDKFVYRLIIFLDNDHDFSNAFLQKAISLLNSIEYVNFCSSLQLNTQIEN